MSGIISWAVTKATSRFKKAEGSDRETLRPDCAGWTRG
jgi:hypothetical protein